MNPLRRKLAIATWSAPREGNIYGKLTVDAGPALRYIDEVRAATGARVTVTHLVGRAVAEALRRSPGLNGYLRFGKYIPRKTVDVTFLVALEGGGDLAKARVERADDKSPAAIADELGALATRLREGKDVQFEKGKGIIRLLPTWILRPVIWLTGFITGSLGWSFAGQEPFPFGSCVITSVGMFGLDEGFAPPTPFARVPLLVLIGAVRDQAVVVDGAVAVRPQLTITATIDHRFIDGFQGATLAKTVAEVMANPWMLDQPR
ncbi:MAG: 2-oxo acid dehydrogenase subunit E2 [Myxococcales bacterium]|nr:2-oxo acid dehydrogenase subunit E2 [Myxococcales bacterium]